MKENKKKPAFEPISNEEAKRITARNTGDLPRYGSGSSLCNSGTLDPYAVCQYKYEYAPCCYLDNGREVSGACRHLPDNFDEIYRLKCVTDYPEPPWENDKKPR